MNALYDYYDGLEEVAQIRIRECEDKTEGKIASKITVTSDLEIVDLEIQ